VPEDADAAAGDDLLLTQLEACGALRRGHFQLSSGLHSPGYVQCALLLQDPARARTAGRRLASRLTAYRPQSILSPALGGVVIGHEVAAALGVPFRFTERQGAAMALRRGFALRPGERVAIVEDVVTTGKSTAEVAALAAEAGAVVVAVGALLDRSGGRHGFAVPLAALATLDLPTYEPAACPDCRAGETLDQPGSRPR
jgi:orotate phosphoribosyltransferase